MSDESGGKKSVGGHIAVALAGIGALFARTVDDCGRVALKGGAVMSENAARNAGRVGSLADDGLRTGGKLGSLAEDGARAAKYGPLAEDGMRAAKYGPLAEDGIRNGAHLPPYGDAPRSLIEEASAVGAKTESHAGEAIEFGVDVSLEVISNMPVGDSDDDSDSAPNMVGPLNRVAKDPLQETMTLLRGRNRISQPALLPVMPTSPKAFQFVLGRPDKSGEGSAFVSMRPIPDDGLSAFDPFKWLKGRLSHNPIALVFYTSDRTETQKPIPLVLPNGETTDDSLVQRACIEHFSHCILLICKPEKAGYKEPCAKSVVDGWQSITTSATDMPLQSLLEQLVAKRANTPALRNVTISRLDVSQDAPRIVRSRLTIKKP
jgi:hypothetical protein